MVQHDYTWSGTWIAIQRHLNTYPVETLDLQTRRILARNIAAEIESLMPMVAVDLGEEDNASLEADLKAAAAMLEFVKVAD